MSNYLTEKITDCSQCALYNQESFKYHSLQRNKRMAIECGTTNSVFFLINGTISINNDEFSNQTVTDGQFFLLPIESSIEIIPITEAEMISISFDLPPKVCEHHFDKSVTSAQISVRPQKILNMKFPLRLFMQGLKINILEGLGCQYFLDAKMIELYALLNNYYTHDELLDLYSPIYRNTRTFQRFVLNNYRGVKDVEDFARKAGYSLSTFRRLFKKSFGMPAYQWILKKKCECIMEDLKNKDIPIKSICEKYEFDSLSNFSHFCKTYFGFSPREFRITVEQ